MAHFAQLDENNVVIRVIVVNNENVLDSNGKEIEQIGIDFCKNLFGSETKWKQTSYNSNIRVRYAGARDTYHEEMDAFIPPKPFASWVLNKDTADWDAPVARPELTEVEIEARSYYSWDEETGAWILNETP